MAPPRFDAWMNPAEWQSVYKLLYSEELGSRKRGLSHVRMWRARVPRLPLSIESTEELVHASLESGDRDTILATYSLAVIRFVNGQIDKAQNGVYARSVANVAADLEIPDWIIDIRHDATHKALPSLQSLRLAGSAALAWLEEKYWKLQANCIKEAEKRVRRELEKYLSLQRDVLVSEKENKKINKTNLTLTMEQISSFTQYEQNYLVPILASSIAATDYNMPLWRGLLTQLNRIRPDSIAILIFLLCRSYSNFSTSNSNFSYWLDQIIAQHLFNHKCKQMYPLYVELLLKGRDQGRCRDICQKILNHCSVSGAGKYGQVRELFNILSNSKGKYAGNVPDQISEIKNVLTQLERKRALSSKTTEQNERRFKLCQNEDRISPSPWNSTPFGCLTHDMSLSMELPCKGATAEAAEDTAAEAADNTAAKAAEDTEDFMLQLKKLEEQEPDKDSLGSWKSFGSAEQAVNDYLADKTYDTNRLIRIMHSVRMLDHID